MHDTLASVRRHGRSQSILGLRVVLWMASLHVQSWNISLPMGLTELLCLPLVAHLNSVNNKNTNFAACFMPYVTNSVPYCTVRKLRLKNLPNFSCKNLKMWAAAQLQDHHIWRVEMGWAVEVDLPQVLDLPCWCRTRPEDKSGKECDAGTFPTIPWFFFLGWSMWVVAAVLLGWQNHCRGYIWSA